MAFRLLRKGQQAGREIATQRSISISSLTATTHSSHPAVRRTWLAVVIEHGVVFSRRPRPYTRRRLIAELRAFLRRNRWRLVQLAGIWLAMQPVALLMDGYLRGLYQGTTLMLFLAMVGLVFLVQTEGLSQLVGGWGEDATRTEIDAARKRGHLWGAVHNIEWGGHDLDHLVLAPAGVIAVESKWKRFAVDPSQLERDALQAQAMADWAQRLLRSKDVGHQLAVRPLVVVWGRGRRAIPEGGTVVEGVSIVRGEELADWLAAHAVGLLGREIAEEVRRRVTGFRDRAVRRTVAAETFGDIGA